MKKTQAIDIDCPNCGAPIDIGDITSNKTQCSHCNSSIVLKNLPRPKRKKGNQKSAEALATKGDGGKQVESTNTWAHASVILGIISLFGLFVPIFCFPVNIVGIIAGITGKDSSQKQLAVAGIIINSIAFLFNILFTVIYLTSPD